MFLIQLLCSELLGIDLFVNCVQQSVRIAKATLSSGYQLLQKCDRIKDVTDIFKSVSYEIIEIPHKANLGEPWNKENKS